MTVGGLKRLLLCFILLVSYAPVMAEVRVFPGIPGITPSGQNTRDGCMRLSSFYEVEVASESDGNALTSPVYEIRAPRDAALIGSDFDRDEYMGKPHGSHKHTINFTNFDCDETVKVIVRLKRTAHHPGPIHSYTVYPTPLAVARVEGNWALEMILPSGAERYRQYLVRINQESWLDRERHAFVEDGLLICVNPVHTPPNINDPDVIVVQPGESLPHTWHGQHKTIYLAPGIHENFTEKDRCFGRGGGREGVVEFYIPGDAYVKEQYWINDTIPFRFWGRGILSSERYMALNNEKATGASNPWGLKRTFSAAVFFGRDDLSGAKKNILEGITFVHCCNVSWCIDDDDTDVIGCKAIGMYHRKGGTWQHGGDDDGQHAHWNGCFVHAGDDTFYVDDVLRIKNCSFWTGANGPIAQFGWGRENMSNIKFQMTNCDVLWSDMGGETRNRSLFNSREDVHHRWDGGPTIFENITVWDEVHRVFRLRLWEDEDKADRDGYLKDIIFRNINIKKRPRKRGEFLGGTNNGYKGTIRDITFDNVRIAGTLITRENFKDYFDTNQYTLLDTFTFIGDASLPVGWTHHDIGDSGITGRTTFNGDTFTMEGSRHYIGGAADTFHYAYKSFAGDGGIVAKLVDISDLPISARAGVMIRADTSAGAAHISLVAQPHVSRRVSTGLMIYRETTGGVSQQESLSTGITLPQWLSIQRAGGLFICSLSDDGIQWQEVGAQTIPMDATVQAGLFLTGAGDEVLASAQFTDMQVTGSVEVSPIAHYSFEDNANDVVGNHHGSLSGGPTFVPGWLDLCVDLDGSNDQVVIPRSISRDFSIAFWTRTHDSAGNGDHWWSGAGLVDGEVGGYKNDFGIALLGQVAAFGIGKSGGDTTIKCSSSISDGQWHHISATRREDNGAMKLYIDGMVEATGSGSTGSKSAPNRLTVGSLQTNKNYFDGQIDELMLFDQVLEVDEIQALMTLK